MIPISGRAKSWSMVEPMSATDRRRARGRERQREYRARLRAGQRLYSVTALEHDLVEALRKAGRLDDVRALDPAEVEHALTGLIHDWTMRWRYGDGVTDERSLDL
jgi:hypothetical protein